jgi:hypothetical protein
MMIICCYKYPSLQKYWLVEIYLHDMDTYIFVIPYVPIYLSVLKSFCPKLGDLFSN